LHLYTNYPGHVFNWAVTAPVNLSLKAGKKLFKSTVLGGMDNRGVLANGSPEEIQSAVHKIIRTVGPKNLIIGADCTLPTEINVENIRLAIDAAAAYPIQEQEA